MGVRLEYHDKEFNKKLSQASAEGLLRAGSFLHTRARLAVNRSNPRNRKTGKYDKPSLPGTPPKARTGFGRDNVVLNYNRNEADPVVRVGVTRNALYMFFHEVGIRYSRGRQVRPWLLATLAKYREQIGRLALLGGGK